MDIRDIKKAIKDFILSDSESKGDYDILLKNKIGYMTNKVHEHSDKQGKYVGEFTKYYITNSDEDTKDVYKNIINFKTKEKFEKSTGKKISGSDFYKAIKEVIDDLSE
jgi:hypothetical protein